MCSARKDEATVTDIIDLANTRTDKQWKSLLDAYVDDPECLHIDSAINFDLSTDAGMDLIAHALVLAARLDTWELRVLRNDPPLHWGASVGATIEILQSKDLMSGYDQSPLGRAVLRIREEQLLLVTQYGEYMRSKHS